MPILFLGWIGLVIFSGAAIGKAQEEVKFPQVGDVKMIEKEPEVERIKLDKMNISPGRSEVVEEEGEGKRGKNHGCTVVKSYKCDGGDCEKTEKTTCYEKGN